MSGRKMVTESMWHVYILHCADNTYYTGIAKNVDERTTTHNAGRGAKYTRGRLPVSLVYSEAVADRPAALRRELAIKTLSRAEKIKLIESKAAI